MNFERHDPRRALLLGVRIKLSDGTRVTKPN